MRLNVVSAMLDDVRDYLLEAKYIARSEEMVEAAKIIDEIDKNLVVVISMCKFFPFKCSNKEE